MSKALDHIKILDFTHVQSGPTCTQLLAWMGADVIKVERPGVGDATRKQLVDVEGADSLYFTMLNHNKRSITLNTKTDDGKAIFRVSPDVTPRYHTEPSPTWHSRAGRASSPTGCGVCRNSRGTGTRNAGSPAAYSFPS